MTIECNFPPLKMWLRAKIDWLRKSINLLTPNRQIVNGDFVRINGIVKWKFDLWLGPTVLAQVISELYYGDCRANEIYTQMRFSHLVRQTVHLWWLSEKHLKQNTCTHIAWLPSWLGDFNKLCGVSERKNL